MTEEYILQLLSQVDQLHASIKKLLVEETTETPVEKVMPVEQVTPIVVEPVVKPNSINPLLSILASQNWPAATNPAMICDPNSESDKVDRAKGILDLLIETNLTKKKFLDYGCGEGHCVIESLTKNPATALGFDIKSHPKWNKDNFTTDFNVVKNAAPFDVILLFDVLDHVEQESPLNVLKKATSVLSANGEIYVRFHPFTSRHATHAYHAINKAFIHMIFTNEELGLKPDSFIPNVGVVRPVLTYEGYIRDAGLKIKNRKDTTENIEDFFKNIPTIKNKIINAVGIKEFPEFQCSLQFIDYILQKQ